MTRGDFLPVGRYVATAIGYNELTKDGGSFEWQIVDDWRLNDKPGAALVQMRFKVIRAKGTEKYSYRWKFDDGTIETGESLEHVFLRTGMCTVTFEVLEGPKVVAEVAQKVHAHALWDKVHPEPRNIQTFEKAISESDFGKVPVGSLVNLYSFADGLERPDLKQQVVTALMKRVDELVAAPRHRRFCLELARHLRSAPIRQYEQALRLLAGLREKSTEDRRIQQQAMVAQAELLLQCFGKVQEAIEILSQLDKKRDFDSQTARRFGIIRAEALIAVGQANRAREVLVTLVESSTQRKRAIKHMGMLRHARLLAEARDDAVQMDYAMEKIETILSEDPVKVLMPSLNLVRLDIHLARAEYLIAFHLAQRLNKLELSNYYKLEVLVRQVRALCGIKAVEQAKVIYEAIAKDYPYSPVVAEAKKAIVEVVMAGQGQ
jgi:hypothetical protein